MDFQRLPQIIKPISYSVFLFPNLENFVLEGSVIIDLEVKNNCNIIKLNVSELEINDIILTNEEKTEVKYNGYNVCPKTEVLSINLEVELVVGRYALKILYKGVVNEHLRGFYRSKVINDDGEEIYQAATYFTPTEARKCFPCWDEPVFKAIFNIEVKCPCNFIALSNMPVKASQIINNFVVFQFESSPIMSTYLVAIVIGEYAYLESTTNDGIKVRTYSEKNKVEQSLFALDVAVKSIDFYTNYFNVPYPLPKLDLIALADLEVGAMEHWGLITYRNKYLLLDPENSSTTAKEHIALIVAHEVAHQWFGNLVTMEWWTHIWLNEGYASFMQYLTVDKLYPEFKVWTSFISQTYQMALELDSLGNSHPIEVEVGHPSEVNQIFDVISYKKGCSILRMLHNYIGDNHFRQGMHNYLTKYKYQNAETCDLWKCLETASVHPISQVMSSWTEQTGYPVLTVNVSRHEKETIMKIKQKRFILHGDEHFEEDSIWHIPLSIEISGPHKYKTEVLLKSHTFEISLPTFNEEEWIKINPNLYGFYRVHYESNMLVKFMPAIRQKVLSAFDRLGFITDMFELSRAGYTKTVDALNLLKAYENEDDPTIWTTIIQKLTKLRTILAGTSCEKPFQEYTNKLLKKISTELTWNTKPNEDHTITKLRPLVYVQLIINKDQETLGIAKQKFEDHLRSAAVLHPDMRLPIYKGVVESNYTNIIDILLKKFRENETNEEKYDIIHGLSVSKSETQLTKLVEFIMSDEVRNQDKCSLLQIIILSSQQAAQLVWNYFKDNFGTFKGMYEGTFLIQHLISAFKMFVRGEEADELEEFFKLNPMVGTEMCVKQTIETIRISASWFERDFGTIEEYFLL